MRAPVRYFSAEGGSSGKDVGTESSEQSIFASADYFKDVKPEEIIDPATSGAADVAESSAEIISSKVDEMLWMDSNDSLGSTMSYMTKDVENLVQGAQTYGFSEALIYYEAQIWDLWMFFAETQGMGMGFGVVSTALVMRGMFAPVIIYSQTVGMKMKLMGPDQDEVTAAMKRHQQ